jgi:hypothetical protein
MLNSKKHSRSSNNRSSNSYNSHSNKKTRKSSSKNDIEIQKDEKILRFLDHNTNCYVSFYTGGFLSYDLRDFSCGSRGKGNGAKLLLYALEYITNDANIPKRMQPFRIDLLAVPKSSNQTLNDDTKLINYYKKLGFADDTSRPKGTMFGIISNLILTIKTYLKQQSAGRRRKRKTKRLH